MKRNAKKTLGALILAFAMLAGGVGVLLDKPANDTALTNITLGDPREPYGDQTADVMATGDPREPFAAPGKLVALGDPREPYVTDAV